MNTSDFEGHFSCEMFLNTVGLPRKISQVLATILCLRTNRNRTCPIISALVYKLKVVLLFTVSHVAYNVKVVIGLRIQKRCKRSRSIIYSRPLIDWQNHTIKQAYQTQ